MPYTPATPKTITTSSLFRRQNSDAPRVNFTFLLAALVFLDRVRQAKAQWDTGYPLPSMEPSPYPVNPDDNVGIEKFFEITCYVLLSILTVGFCAFGVFYLVNKCRQTSASDDSEAGQLRASPDNSVAQVNYGATAMTAGEPTETKPTANDDTIAYRLR